MNAIDHFFSDLGDFDPDCCDHCKRAHELIAKAKEDVTRLQAASPMANMPLEEQVLKIELKLTPVPKENRVEVECVSIIEKGEEKPTERKVMVISNALEQVTKLAMRTWSMAYTGNDAIDRIDTLLNDLSNEEERGATNVGGSSTLN